MYEYRAQIMRVVDGGTLELDIELGFSIRTKEIVRLARVTVPEIGTPAGVQAELFLGQFIGQTVLMYTRKDRLGEWQHYQSEITVQHRNNFANLSDLLVNSGHTVFSEGTQL